MGTRYISIRSTLIVFSALTLNCLALADGPKAAVPAHAGPGANGTAQSQTAVVEDDYWSKFPPEFVKLAKRYCFSHLVASWNFLRVSSGNKGLLQTPDFSVCAFRPDVPFNPDAEIWNFQRGIMQNKALQPGFKVLNKLRHNSGDMMVPIAVQLEGDRLTSEASNLFSPLFNPHPTDDEFEARALMVSEPKFRDELAGEMKKMMYAGEKNSVLIGYLDRLNELDENPTITIDGVSKTLSFAERKMEALRRLRGDLGGEGSKQRTTFSEDRLAHGPFANTKLLAEIGVGEQERTEWQKLFADNSAETTKYRGDYIKGLALKLIKGEQPRSTYWESILKYEHDPKGYSQQLSDAAQNYFKVASPLFYHDENGQLVSGGMVHRTVSDYNQLVQAGKLPAGSKLHDTLNKATEYFEVQEIPRFAAQNRQNALANFWAAANDALARANELTDASQSKERSAKLSEAAGYLAQVGQATGDADVQAKAKALAAAAKVADAKGALSDDVNQLLGQVQAGVQAQSGEAYYRWLMNTRKMVDSRDFLDKVRMLSLMGRSTNTLATHPEAAKMISITGQITKILAKKVDQDLNARRAVLTDLEASGEAKDRAAIPVLKASIAEMQGRAELLKGIASDLAKAKSPAELSPRALYFMASNDLSTMVPAKLRQAFIMHQPIFQEGSIATNGGTEFDPERTRANAQQQAKYFEDLFTDKPIQQPVAHAVNRIDRLLKLGQYRDQADKAMSDFLKKRAERAKKAE